MPRISLPQPRYPDAAKERRVGGRVKVAVLVNAESGRVERACVAEGDDLLRDAAEAAARQARFPPYLNDSYIKETHKYLEGVITYNFVLQ